MSVKQNATKFIKYSSNKIITPLTTQNRSNIGNCIYMIVALYTVMYGTYLIFSVNTICIKITKLLAQISDFACYEPADTSSLGFLI